MTQAMTAPRDETVFPTGQYGAILCDPPWKFEAYSNKGITSRSAESHYTTQCNNVLSEIPVEGLAARDSLMFMWAVDSHLDQAIALMQAWGFEYKTIAFNWIKTTNDGTRDRIGMGLWTRKASEVCLLGKRGKPPRNDKGVSQVIMEPRREHSRKPDCQYERIERLVDGPYIELFARQPWPGWTAWGNETTKFAGAAE